MDTCRCRTSFGLPCVLYCRACGLCWNNHSAVFLQDKWIVSVFFTTSKSFQIKDASDPPHQRVPCGGVRVRADDRGARWHLGRSRGNKAGANSSPSFPKTKSTNFLSAQAHGPTPRAEQLGFHSPLGSLARHGRPPPSIKWDPGASVSNTARRRRVAALRFFPVPAECILAVPSSVLVSVVSGLCFYASLGSVLGF